MEFLDKINEAEAAKAFSKQALVFDEYDEGNTIIQYKRKRVREHVLRYMPLSGEAGSSGGSGASGGSGDSSGSGGSGSSGSRGSILELNSGTGRDAIFFADQGYRVHATDIAEGMQQQLKEKVQWLGLTDRVSAELCSFNALDQLQEKGPYDLIFSNFAGLNCTNRLDQVLQSFSPLVKPGGQVTLVILPGFSLWEALLVFKGKFRTAFRRFFGSRGTKSHVEGVYFKCWYYSPSYVIRQLAADFDLLGLEGLCTFVPPSYIENFAEKRPGLYRRLCRMEDRWKGRWPWRSIGDYYIISFRKRG